MKELILPLVPGLIVENFGLSAKFWGQLGAKMPVQQNIGSGTLTIPVCRIWRNGVIGMDWQGREFDRIWFWFTTEARRREGRKEAKDGGRALKCPPVVLTMNELFPWFGRFPSRCKYSGQRFHAYSASRCPGFNSLARTGFRCT